MTLTDFMIKGAIRCNLEADNKRDAIGELVDALVDCDALPKGRDSIVKTAMDRETLGSTAIGRGLAFPRAICSDLDQSVATVGSFCPGVDFDSVDGSLVTLVFLTVAPPSSQRVATLGQIARFVGDAGTRERLVQADAIDEVWRSLEEWSVDHTTQHKLAASA